MLAKRIIPCLDIKQGRVVKGTSFVGLRDAGDPVELAKRYNEELADELVFLDIAASLENRGARLELVRKLAQHLFIPFTIGGGVSSVEDMHALLGAGADKVSVNSAALKNPQVISEGASRFGSQCIVVAIDAKQTGPQSWEVFSHGGTRPTGWDALEWAKQVESLGAGEILLTSMDEDGQQNGFALELTSKVSRAASIPVIASGGGGALSHFKDVFLEGAADAALAASIFHFQTLSISEVKQSLLAADIPVRI